MDFTDPEVIALIRQGLVLGLISTLFWIARKIWYWKKEIDNKISKVDTNHDLMLSMHRNIENNLAQVQKSVNLVLRRMVIRNKDDECDE